MRPTWNEIPVTPVEGEGVEVPVVVAANGARCMAVPFRPRVFHRRALGGGCVVAARSGLQQVLDRGLLFGVAEGGWHRVVNAEFRPATAGISGQMISQVRAEAVRPLLVIGLALTGPDFPTMPLLSLTLPITTIYIRYMVPNSSTVSGSPAFATELRLSRSVTAASEVHFSKTL